MKKALVTTFNRGLHALECAMIDKSPALLEYPPVFIIGAPRSGSTLLYQAMLNSFDFGYLSNLHCRFYGAPALLERMAHIASRPRRADFQSEFGRVPGWSAPSECGAFWYRFFRHTPQYVPLEEANPKSLACLRGALRALGNSMKKPLLFKNLPCALRLEPLASATPEALYIVIKRDEVDNAHSLLEGRKKVFGNYNNWWSSEPPDVEQLKLLPCHQQVVEQIRSIHRIIDQSRERIGHERIFDLSYEDFCADAQASLGALNRFFNGHQIPLAQHGEVPASFERRREVKIDAEIYRELVAYVGQ